MITSNIKEIISGLDNFERKQIPYAASLALNATAEIAMQSMKHKIDKEFNITASWNKVGGKYGIKKQRATKKKLEVEIFIPTNNTWLQDHEEGDSRLNQLIPTNYFKLAFPNLKTNRSIKKKATTLLSNKKKNRIFEAPIYTGYGTERKEGSKKGGMAIYQRLKGKTAGVRGRKGKGKKLLKAKRTLLRYAVPLFIIKKSIKEKPVLEFYKTIPKVFNKNISNEFSKALKYAISTSK